MSKVSRKKSKVAAGTKPGAAEVLTTDYALSGSTVLWFQAVLIIVVGLWVYSPAFNGGWLWDDDVYITKNPLMNDPARLWKAWFEPGSFMEYYPIGQTVQWYQWQLWHLDTFGYHLTNILLHIVSALLIWRLFTKLGLPLAWLGGLIFVSHPVNVESVAWIVELKNTLSLPPFLLTMCAWIDFEERRQTRDYLLALGLFIIAMLCKTTMAPFPVIILLYAWWKRGRIDWNDLRFAVPFFVISLLLLEVALHTAQTFSASVQTNVPALLPLGDLFSRVVLAGLALAFDFSLCLLPLQTLPIYPLWKVDPTSFLQLLPWPILAAIVGLLWWKRQTWGRHILLGLGFFVINVAPFLTFGWLFHPRDTWVMNHFLYIPIIGLIGIVVAGIGTIGQRLSKELKPLTTGFITLLVVLLAFLAHAYAGAFVNAKTYWIYTLQGNPGAWTANINLGKIYNSENEFEKARECYEAALAYNPDSAEANANLGANLVEMGQVDDGIQQLKKALDLDSNNVPARINLGVVLAQTGHLPEALAQLKAAVKIEPNYAQAYYNMGNIFMTLGQLPDALKNYQRALEVYPHYSAAHSGVGNVLLKQGDKTGALEEFMKAVSLNSHNIDARNNLGLLFAQSGRITEAREQFEAVLQLDPQNRTAQNGLAQLK